MTVHRCVLFIVFAWVAPSYAGEIHTLARNGDASAIQGVLAEHPELGYSLSEEGWTPLQLASREGHRDAVHALLGHEAAVDYHGSDGSTALHLAAAAGHRPVVDLLLAAGANPNTRDLARRTPLHAAAATVQTGIATLLVERGANPRIRALDRTTPLDLAVLTCNAVLVKSLLASGAPLNRRFLPGGFTPLHYAVLAGCASIVELLVTRGAMVDEATVFGNTALFYAAGAGHLDVARLLLDQGAAPTRVNLDGYGPLHAAAYAPSVQSSLGGLGLGMDHLAGPVDLPTSDIRTGKDHVAITRLLLERGSRVNGTSVDGNTPLHLAAARTNVATAELLLANGAQVGARNGMGRTVLQEAVNGGSALLVTRLLAEGADATTADSQGVTALHFAAGRRDLQVVELLLEAGASADSIDERGISPIHIARATRYAALIDRLSKRSTDSRAISPVRQVLGLGSLARIQFEGNRTFSAAAIRDALRMDLEFKLASHPRAPLTEYLAGLQERVTVGYRRAGFANVSVDARVDGAAGRVRVVVTEGPRYVQGPIDVRGARNVPAAVLIARLTSPADAGAPRRASEITDTMTIAAVHRQVGLGAVPEAVWVAGRPAAFDDGSRQLLLGSVRDALAGLGYSLARVQVDVEPAPQSGHATLLIRIEDEGVQGTIQEFDVVGLRNNTEQDVLDYLDLAPGVPFDTKLLQALNRSLWESGRFVEHVLAVYQTGATDSAFGLQLDLQEHPNAPPLAKPWSPNEQSFMRLQAWLTSALAGGGDLVFATRPAASRAGIRGIVAQGGTLTEWIPPTESPPAETADANPATDYLALADDLVGIVLLSPGRITLVNQKYARKLTIAGVMHGIRVMLDLDLEPHTFPVQKLFRASALIDWSTIQPFDLSLNLTPGFFVDMAHQFETTKNGDSTLRTFESFTGSVRGRVTFDTESGALQAAQFATNTGTVNLAIETGMLDRAVTSLDRKARDYEDIRDQGNVLGSLIFYVLKNALDRSIAASPASASSRRAANAALLKLQRANLFDDLNGIIARWFVSEDSFTSSSARAGSSASMMQKVMGELTLIMGGVVEEMLDADAWPSIVARETVLVVAGSAVYTELELERLYSSETMGPLGFLTIAGLLAQAGSPTSTAFAQAGLSRLAEAEWRKDVRALLNPEAPAGRMWTALVSAMGELDDAEFDALDTTLLSDMPGPVRAMLRVARLASAHADGEFPPVEFDALWIDVLRSPVRASLETLAGR